MKSELNTVFQHHLGLTMHDTKNKPSGILYEAMTEWCSIFFHKVPPISNQDSLIINQPFKAPKNFQNRRKREFAKYQDVYVWSHQTMNSWFKGIKCQMNIGMWGYDFGCGRVTTKCFTAEPMNGWSHKTSLCWGCRCLFLLFQCSFLSVPLRLSFCFHLC